MTPSRLACWALLLAVGWGSTATAAAAPQIHTVAGGGSCTAQFPNPTMGLPPLTLPCNGVSATSVPINQARGVAALPGGGFLYIDYINHLVREVSPSGTVTTVAGNGTTNDTVPAGTLAVNSGLDDPVSVAPLPGGGFLITEFSHSVVQMVSPGSPATATITTIAGTGSPGSSGQSGPATKFPLNDPTDAEPLADGQVLIADYGNNAIELLSSASPTATISTIAGGGSCNDETTTCDGMPASGVGLDQPASVSPIDGGAGGYLIDEYGSSSIREVSQVSPSGTFSTVAGIPGNLGYSGDGGPATAAQLNSPEQVVSTPDGGFLIADTNNEVIRQVSPSGTISTVAGDGMASFAGDGGDATAASLDTPDGVSPVSGGGILIADDANNVIRQVTIPPTTTISISPSAPNGSNGWYTSAVTATTSATEDADTSCELDPSIALTAFGELPPSCPYVGAGASITGNGQHTLYAASVNSFGDQETPTSVSFKIDATPPTLTCAGSPAFQAGTKGVVAATLADTVSGPASLPVTEPVSTSSLGKQKAAVSGVNGAGITGQAQCPYTVVAAALHPLPGMTWKFAVRHKKTTVSRLAATHVPGGAAVNVSCRGAGCRFSRATRPGRGGTVNLTGLFAHASLAAGARLTVSVTKRNDIGRVWLFGVRAGAVPSHRVSCLAPGSSVVGRRCPSSGVPRL